MSWTNEHDLILCKETIFVNPFSAKKKSAQRSVLWQQIADNLNATDKPRFLVDKRAVRDHIQVLIDRFKRKEAQEARESGTCQEHKELDNAVEQVIAMESTESEETEDMNAKKLQDRAKAEAMRNKAMETHGKRKVDETGASGSSSKKRRSGGDTIVYLREKAAQEQSLRQEELKLKQAQHDLERKKSEAMMAQQTRMENQQAEMLQMMRQQQEQNRLMMVLMDNILNK